MKVISRGQVQQVPAQSQNRGPGNSTGDDGSQTGEGYIQGAGSAGPRTKSKPRPRQLNG
uniref:Uncharacterized protein n=1 Tax=Klebsiella pneumoniae TaxID=573 RepID=A0A6G9HNH1_KLEPN|nr:hypothetical protein [Klebsiella pneumoniae]